jgi:hypothetical protein
MAGTDPPELYLRLSIGVGGGRGLVVDESFPIRPGFLNLQKIFDWAMAIAIFQPIFLFDKLFLFR